MIRLKNIDHVCLWVRSLSEAKSYYEKVFGFVCKPREGDATTLVVESENVHFFISEEAAENSFLSRQHLSFEVDSLEHVISALNEMGISDYEQGEVRFFSHRNYKWCEWRDPSGIRLECVEMIVAGKGNNR
jgi:catechol 2,3-dioxygenase-like lactoylglutathione lyase family enzyme